MMRELVIAASERWMCLPSGRNKLLRRPPLRQATRITQVLWSPSNVTPTKMKHEREWKSRTVCAIYDFLVLP